jgi:6-phosphogluconolactonase
MVPADDPASNFGAARRDLIESVPLGASQVHPMPTGIEPETAAAEYQREMADILGPSPVFDLVLLGLGSDGHTASLFPGRPEPADPNVWVLPVVGGTPAVARLTLTPPLINRSSVVCFLVTGAGKAAAVRRVLAGGDSQLPAAWIQPTNGRLLWILDRAAAAMVRES